MNDQIEGFDSLETPIAVVRGEKFIQANFAFYEFFKLGVNDEISELSLQNMLFPEDVKRVLGLMKDEMQTLSSISLKVKPLGKLAFSQNGDERDVELWVAPLGGEHQGHWAISVRRIPKVQDSSKDPIHRIRELYLSIGGHSLLSEEAFISASKFLFSELGWGVGVLKVNPRGAILNQFLTPRGVSGPAWDFGMKMLGKLVPFSQLPRFLEAVHQRKEIRIQDMPVGIGWIKKWNAGDLSQMAEVAQNLAEEGFRYGYGVPVVVHDRVKRFVVVAAKELSEKDTLAIQFFASQLGAVLLVEEILKDSKRQDQMAVLGQMSAIIAHEVRNPITVILQAHHQIQKAFVNNPSDLKKVQQLFDMTSEEIKSLEKLVNNLLNYSKPLSAQCMPTSLHSVVNLSLAVHRELKNPGFFCVDFPRHLPDVWADPLLLRQSIDPLLSNACAQAELTNSKVKVSAALKDEQCIQLRIKNEKAEISIENMEKIFDPFFTTKAVGSGLGLAVAKRLVEIQGGELFIEKEGQGVTFIVSFPAYFHN